jgi:uncharacterized membrane protein
MKMPTRTKRTVICGLCIALCYVLPIAFHSIGLGSVLSPMHIPVLLCGIVCGPLYGLACGVVGPVLSSLLSSMPPAMALIWMVPELAIYGLVAGLLMRCLPVKHFYGKVYAALAIAMVAGRVVGGIASALFHLGTAGSYTLSMFVSSYIVGSLPGIAAHLILVPALVFTLVKTKAVSKV